ncbi:hypothetical protein pipiens_006493 [Culex pipiens pipiens]|uniref:Uncharacterized protein n=1 Tax=Culex pipiens pipiens TaxID=38569 RepID=A0ABD1DP91_CULPP
MPGQDMAKDEIKRALGRAQIAYPTVGPDTIVAASRSGNLFGTFAFASPVSSRSRETPNVVPTQLPDVAGTVTTEVPSRTGNPFVTSASASPVSSRNVAPTLRPDVAGTVTAEVPSRTGNPFATSASASPVSSRNVAPTLRPDVAGTVTTEVPSRTGNPFVTSASASPVSSRNVAPTLRPDVAGTVTTEVPSRTGNPFVTSASASPVSSRNVAPTLRPDVAGTVTAEVPSRTGNPFATSASASPVSSRNVAPTLRPDVAGTVTTEVPSRTGNPFVTSASASPVSSRNVAPTLRPDVAGTVTTEVPSRTGNPFVTSASASPVSSRNVAPTLRPDVAGTVTTEVPSRTGNPFVASASASPVSSRNVAPTLRPDVAGTVKTEDPSRTGNTFGTFFFTSPVSSRSCETTNVAATPQQPQEIADSSVIIEEGMDNHEDYCVNEDQSWTSDLNFSFSSQLEDPIWKFQIEAAPEVIYNNVARAATPTIEPSVRANPVFQHQPGTSNPINVNAHVIQSVDSPAVAFMWSNPTANQPTGAEWNQPARPLDTHPQNLESLPQEPADSVEEEMGNGEDHEDVHDQFLSADLDLSFSSQLEDPIWKFQIEAAPAVIYNNVARSATPTIEPSVRANPVFQHQPGTSNPINVNAHVIQSVDSPAVAFMWSNPTANQPTGAEWNQPARPLDTHPQNLESLPQEPADSVEEEMGNGEDHEDVHDQFLSADLDLSFSSQLEDPIWKFQIEAAPAVIYNNVARSATPTIEPSVRANPVFQHQPGTSNPINVNAHVIQSVDSPAVAFMWSNPTANQPTGAEWNQPARPLDTHPQNLESLPQEPADSVEEEMGNGEDHEDVHDQFLSADLDLSFSSQLEDPIWKFQIEAAPAVIYNNVARSATPTIEPSVRANPVFQHQPGTSNPINVNAHVIQSVDSPAVAFMWSNPTANQPTGAEWNQPARPLDTHPQNLESLPQEPADSVEEEMGNGEDHEDVHDQFLSADLDLSFNSQLEDPTWKFQIEAAPAVIYNNIARAATPTIEPSAPKSRSILR